MSEEEILEHLQNHSEYLTVSNIFTDMLRFLAESFINGLIWMIDSLASATDGILAILDLRTENGGDFQSFLASLRQINYLMLTIVILGAGVLLFFAKDKFAKDLPVNLFLITALLAIMPTALGLASNQVRNIHNSIVLENEGISLAENIVLQNIEDVRLLATRDWEDWEDWHTGQRRNNMPSFDRVNLSEVIDNFDGIELYEPLTFSRGINEAGLPILTELRQEDSGMFDFNPFFQFYYRWHVRWIPILVSLTVIAAALVITGFKFAVLITKLMADYLLLMTTAYADATGMQRIKMILTEIIGSLALIVYMPILLRIFGLMITFISNRNAGLFPTIFMYAGASWMLMEGPNSFQKITGIDAGLKSTAQTMGGILGAVGITKLVKAGAGAVAGGIGAIGSMAGNSASFGLGLATSGASVENGNGLGSVGVHDKPSMGASAKKNDEKEKQANEKGIHDKNVNGKGKEDDQANNQTDPQGNYEDLDRVNQEPQSMEAQETNATGNEFSDAEFISLEQSIPPEEADGMLQGDDGLALQASEYDNAQRTPFAPHATEQEHSPNQTSLEETSAPPLLGTSGEQPTGLERTPSNENDTGDSYVMTNPTDQPTETYANNGMPKSFKQHLKGEWERAKFGHGIDDYRNTKGQNRRARLRESYQSGQNYGASGLYDQHLQQNLQKINKGLDRISGNSEPLQRRANEEE